MLIGFRSTEAVELAKMVKKLGQVNEICNEDFVYSFFTSMNM